MIEKCAPFLVGDIFCRSLSSCQKVYKKPLKNSHKSANLGFYGTTIIHAKVQFW